MKKFKKFVVKDLYNVLLVKQLTLLKLKRQALKRFKRLLTATTLFSKQKSIKHNKKIALGARSLLQQKTSLFNEEAHLGLTRNIMAKILFLGNKNVVSLGEYTFCLYTKFLSFIFKIGKRGAWHKKFSSIFNLLSEKLDYSRALLLLKIFLRLYTRVEVKRVKARKRITYIPFFVKLPRSIFLALKWVFFAVSKKSSVNSFKENLFVELLQILVQKSCLSLQKCSENNANAFKNRSNIHYRWQKTR